MTPLSAEARAAITRSNLTHHDCGVVALMAVTDLPYSKADQLCRRHGFTDTGGTPREALPQVLHDLGYPHRPAEFHHGESVATFALRHEYGRWLVYIDGHVMPLVDGDLYNARGWWSSPVVMALEVHK